MQTHEPAASAPAHGGDPAAGESSPAKQQAADAAAAGKQAATDVASTASDAAKDVAHETAAQTRDLMDKTRGELRDQTGRQQVAVVEHLRSLGDQLAEMTDGVDRQGTAFEVASRARDRVRKAADWLDERDPDELLAELRKVGRNRPGGFVVGSLLAGVLAGRLTRGVVAVHTDDAGAGAHRDDSTTRPRPTGGKDPLDSAHLTGTGHRAGPVS